MAEKELSEFRFEVGESVIGLLFPTKEYAQSMMDYFGVDNSNQEADIHLKLNPVPHEENLDIPDSMFNTKILAGERFIIKDDLVSGYINSENRTGELWFKVGLTVGPVTRVFEQLLYQAFYTACRFNKSDSFLIHSSGVIYKDKGFLFVGASGSGKSTVAALSNDYHVLNDEICLISYINDKAFLHSTPFNGFFRDKKAGSTELLAILFLEHGKAHKIVDIKKSDAVKIFAKEIVPPIALNELLTSEIFIDMIDIADNLYDKTQMKKLQFLPDIGFWEEIDRVFLGGND